ATGLPDRAVQDRRQGGPALEYRGWRNLCFRRTGPDISGAGHLWLERGANCGGSGPVPGSFRCDPPGDPRRTTGGDPDIRDEPPNPVREIAMRARIRARPRVPPIAQSTLIG